MRTFTHLGFLASTTIIHSLCLDKQQKQFIKNQILKINKKGGRVAL